MVKIFSVVLPLLLLLFSNAIFSQEAPDHYIKEFPYGEWRYLDGTAQSQEFASSKRAVIVALFSEGMRLDYPSLNNGGWINNIEKFGKPGVDDDLNGWIDDISGIQTYFSLFGSINKLYLPQAATILANGNYYESGLTNPNGKIKVVPIQAYAGLLQQETDQKALLQGFEYASKVGAEIILIPGFVTNSSLVLKAAKEFKGLIITYPDNNSPSKARSCQLIKAELENVISVGFHQSFEVNVKYYGGNIDLSALGTTSTLWYDGPGLSSSITISAAKVAGHAARLMSCYPDLSALEIKKILLASSEQNRWNIKTSTTGGILRAASAALGRSSGGQFVQGNWALIDSDGPPNCGEKFVTAHNSLTDDIYFLGVDYEDNKYQFYAWEKCKWQKQVVTVPEDFTFEINKYSKMFFRNRVNKLIFFNGYHHFYSLEGDKWVELEFTEGSPLISYELLSFSYDHVNDVLLGLGYDKNKSMLRVYSYNWKEWSLLTKKKIKTDEYLTHFYNPRNKKLLVPEISKDNKYITGYQVFNGKNWKRHKTSKLAGVGGQLVFNSIEDTLLRFGSYHPSSKYPDIILEVGHNIAVLKGKKWENQSHDLPFQISGLGRKMFKVYYSEITKKYTAIGYRNHPGWTGAKNGINMWSYSGDIKPTWIDNLVVSRGDLNGDGKADMAIWQPGDKSRFVVKNGREITLGAWGNIPVPGDYDGDGEVDFAVCERKNDKNREKAGKLIWRFENSKVTFGKFNDIPVPLDYDNDGKTDIAVYNKDTATWYFKGKKPVTFGNPADLPVPADYDGDGRPELATYTPLTSTWHIQGIGDFKFGKPGDSPVPADYDGDGRIDIATWNPRKRLWSVMEWGSGKTLIKERFGNKWDIPVPGDYNGDGKAELATYTPMKALWNIKGQPSVKFGSPGDVPLVRGN